MDPRFAEARARKEAALKKAHLAQKALDETVAQVSATNMHDSTGSDGARTLERLKWTSALRSHNMLGTSVDATRERSRAGAGAGLVKAQRAEWKAGVAEMRAKGLEPPKDFMGARLGDSTDEPAAAAAAAAPGTETASDVRAGESEAERAERRAMEKARKTVMRTMGIPDKRGPKLAVGPHLVDHVRALRQFSSASGDPYLSESKSAYARGAEFDAEVARNARRVEGKLCKNTFTEYTEAVAKYGKMMNGK